MILESLGFSGLVLFSFYLHKVQEPILDR